LTDADCPTLVDPALQSLSVQARRDASHLICEQVVIPNRILNFPPVVWSYFDTDQEKYFVLKKDVNNRVITPSVTVTPPSSLSPPDANISQKLKSATILRAFQVALVAAISIICVATITLLRRNRPRVETALPEDSVDIQNMLHAAENAVANSDVEFFYNIAYAIIQNYAENTYNNPLEVSSQFHFNSNADLSSVLGTTCAYSELHAISASCDKVRYGRILPDETTIAADLEKIKNLILAYPISHRRPIY
jgi:hypothetical protein